MTRGIVELTKEQYDKLIAENKHLQEENKELREDLQWKRSLVKVHEKGIEEASDRFREAERYGKDITVESNKYKRKLTIKKMQYKAALIEIQELKDELFKIVKKQTK